VKNILLDTAIDLVEISLVARAARSGRSFHCGHSLASIDEPISIVMSSPESRNDRRIVFVGTLHSKVG
jgi:hypothetical protein